MVRCHDCDVEEGQLHKKGCNMERCPLCLGQLISCECPDALPYRIPWVRIPVLCVLCGKVDPDLFKVPDGEWKKFVPPNIQKEVLCLFCFQRLKRLFPKGWRKAK